MDTPQPKLNEKWIITDDKGQRLDESVYTADQLTTKLAELKEKGINATPKQLLLG